MPFQRILNELVRTAPKARGAIFVDWEGEAVVQAIPPNGHPVGEEDHYQLKVVGAQQALILSRIEAMMRESETADGLQHLILKMEDQTVIARRVNSDYVLILTVDSGTASAARFHLDKACDLLRAEM